MRKQTKKNHCQQFVGNKYSHTEGEQTQNIGANVECSVGVKASVGLKAYMGVETGMALSVRHYVTGETPKRGKKAPGRGRMVTGAFRGATGIRCVGWRQGRRLWWA